MKFGEATVRRMAFAEWSESPRRRGGALSTESGRIAAVPYSAASRREVSEGTTPEELIAAAQASCFSMSLARELGKLGISLQQIHTIAQVEMRESGFDQEITSIHLLTKVVARGIAMDRMMQVAEVAKQRCAVARLIRAPVHLSMSLKQWGTARETSFPEHQN